MTEARILKREPVFQGRVIDVAVETVAMPASGSPGESAVQEVRLEIVRHPGGAAVVALDDQDRVCLLRQFRHAADGWIWELPAGKIDAGDTPSSCARRELAEEAGVLAEDWIDLGRMHSSPGVFTEIIHLWMARGLERQPHAHEHGELIEIHWLPLAQALDWCNDGQITDAKTLVGLYRADAMIKSALEILSEDPGC
jgi:8-oxo-dGTP pyrophosphatase MutT (NUDIX family)